MTTMFMMVMRTVIYMPWTTMVHLPWTNLIWIMNIRGDFLRTSLKYSSFVSNKARGVSWRIHFIYCAWSQILHTSLRIIVQSRLVCFHFFILVNIRFFSDWIQLLCVNRNCSNFLRLIIFCYRCLPKFVSDLWWIICRVYSWNWSGVNNSDSRVGP